MPNDVLVSVDWLQERLSDPLLRILDVRASDPRLPMGYRVGHIPNSIPFDLSRDAYDHSVGMPTLKSPEAIAQVLASRGISNDSRIVIYDENIGPLAATVYWLLKYLGHDPIRVLHGGWLAWQNAHGAVTREVPQFQPAMYTAQPDESQFGSAEWIQENAARSDVVLLDARTDGEYYSGHIPGAVNLSFDEAMNFSTQSLKDANELKQQFEAVGVTPDKEVVTYCASGARSSHTYLVLKSLGYPRVRNYKGSMMDWAQMRGMPVE
jgi:thiosulfate/3-mercaptopyruvate sulfurtransferase